MNIEFSNIAPLSPVSLINKNESEHINNNELFNCDLQTSPCLLEKHSLLKNHFASYLIDYSFEMNPCYSVLPLLLDCSKRFDDESLERTWTFYDAAKFSSFILDRIIDGKSLFYKHLSNQELFALTHAKTMLLQLKEKQENISYNPSQLEDGQSLLIPFGSTHEFSPQMICSVQRNKSNTFDMSVYSAESQMCENLQNTVFFDFLKGNLSTGCFCFKNIPLQELSSMLSSIVKIKVNTPKELPKALTAVLKPFTPYFVKTDKPAFFIKAQRTQSGAVKAINAMLLHHFGKESFKKISFETKFCGLLAAYQKTLAENFENAQSCQDIHTASKSMLQLLYKNKSQSWLSDDALLTAQATCIDICREMQNRIEQLAPKQPALSFKVNECSQAQDNQTNCSTGIKAHHEIVNNRNALLKKTLKSRPHADLKNQKTILDHSKAMVHIEAASWQNLPAALDDLLLSLNECKKLNQTHLSSLLICQHFFNCNSQLLHIEGILSPPVAEECLQKLAKITDQYQFQSIRLFSNHAFLTKMTLLGSMALAHRLALMADRKNPSPVLEHFGIDILPYKEMIRQDPYLIVQNFDSYQKYLELIAYFDKVNMGKNKLLCNFLSCRLPNDPSEFPELSLLHAYNKRPVLNAQISEQAKTFLCQFNESDKQRNIYPDLVFIQNFRAVAFAGTHSFFPGENNPSLFGGNEISLIGNQLTYQTSKRIWSASNHVIKYVVNGLNSFDLGDCSNTDARYRRFEQEFKSASFALLSQFSHDLKIIQAENAVLHENPKEQSLSDILQATLSVSEVQTAGILELIHKNFDLLKDEKNRRAVELALFKLIDQGGIAISPLFSALHTNPSLFKHLDAITKKAIQLSSEIIRSKGQNTSDIYSFLFAVNIRSIILKNCRKMGIVLPDSSSIEKELSASLENIEAAAFSDVSMLNFKLTRLAFLQIHSYSSLPPEQIALAVSDFIFVKTHIRENLFNISTFNDKGFTGLGVSSFSGFADYFMGQFSSITLWKDCLQDHLKSMSEVIKTQVPSPIEIIRAASKKIVGQSLKQLEWKMSEKGFFFASSDDGDWSVNLSLGEWTSPRGALAQYNDKYEKEELSSPLEIERKRLFPEKPKEMRQSGGFLYFHDSKLGAIRCNIAKNTIEREIKERDGLSYWYVQVQFGNGPGSLPVSFFADHSIWIRSDKKNTLGVISDLKTGKTRCRIENGEFIDKNNLVLVVPYQIVASDDTAKLCLSIPRKEGKWLKSIDPSVQMWGEKKENEILLRKIKFPRLQRLGKTLTFNWNEENKQWIWSENPEFYIEPQAASSPGQSMGFLYLTNGKGKRKLLIPNTFFEKDIDECIRPQAPDDNDVEDGLKGSASYFDFDLDANDHYPLPTSLSTEKKLFLAYFAMAKKHPLAAAKYVNSLSLSDQIQDAERKWIQHIIQSGKPLKDFSPESNAIRLAIFAYAETNNPSSSRADAGKKQKDNCHPVLEIYLSYLQYLNHVLDPLVLSPETEMQIIQSLKPIPEKHQKSIEDRQLALANTLHQDMQPLNVLLSSAASVHQKKSALENFEYERNLSSALVNEYQDPILQLSKAHIKQKNNRHQLIEESSIQTLIEAVKGQSDLLTKQVRGLENKILQLAFPENEKTRQDLYHHAFSLNKPSLKSFFHASVRKDFINAFKEINPSLSQEDANELKSLCISYMLYYTDLQQITKALEASKCYQKAVQSNENERIILQKWEEACKEILAHRPFNPATEPFSLLFEMVSGMRIRKEQQDILKHIFTILQSKSQKEPLEGYLFQLKMAGGKTTVIISSILEIASYFDYIPMIVSHHSQFAFAKSMIQTLQKKRFGKDLISIDFRIADLNKPEILKNILAKLRTAQTRKCPVIMKNALLQTLELKELLDLENSLTANPRDLDLIQERSILLKQINALIKKNGLTILDECHLTLSIKTEVNVPEGIPQPVAFELADLIRFIFSTLCQKPLDDLVGLKKNAQAFLSENDYKETVLPFLIDTLLSKHEILQLLKDKKESFQRYVLSQMDEHPTDGDLQFIQYLDKCAESKEKKINNIANLSALCKTLLTHILPSVLGKTHNRAFGRLPCNKEGKAVPYAGNGIPSHTQFGNILEALCYQFMTALSSGITESQMQILYDKAYEAASVHARNRQLDIESTKESEEFKDLTGFSLKSFTPSQMKEALEFVNKEPSRQLLAEMELSRLHVCSHPLIFRSKSVNIMEQMALPIACSGTVGNMSHYSKFKENTLDEETKLLINQTYKQRHALGQTLIHKADSKSIQEVLKKSLDNHTRQGQVRSLIDAGGFFDKYQNLEAAKEILKYCRQSAHLKEIQGVVFLHRDLSSGAETFAFLCHPDKPFIPLKDTTKEEICKHADFNKVFVFFDELRTIGTDIPLAPDSVNLLTIDGKTMTLSAMQQATLRARQFLETQDVDFVILSQGKKYVKNEGGTVQDIIDTLDDNEKKQTQEKTYRVYVAKIANVFRKKSLDMLRGANNFKEKQQIYQHLKAFLVESNQASPYLLYGQLSKETETLKSLQDYAEKSIKQFIACCASIKGVQDIQQTIKHSLSNILEGAKKDIEQEVLPKTIKSSAHEDNKQESEVEIEKEKALEIQFEQEKEKLFEEEAANDPSLSSKNFYIEKPWAIQPKNLFHQLSSSLLSAQSCVSCPEMKKLFPSNLFVSKNFRSTYTEELPFTHKLQKQAQHLLVLQEDKKQPQFILISKKDAAFFEKLLNEKSKDYPELSIFDLNGFPQTHSSQKMRLKFKESDSFQIGLWHANLLAGRSAYLEKKSSLSEKLFKALPIQTAFNYLLEKAKGKEKVRVLQSELFRSCLIESRDEQVFYFSYRYNSERLTAKAPTPSKTNTSLPREAQVVIEAAIHEEIPAPAPAKKTMPKQAPSIKQEASQPWYTWFIDSAGAILSFPIVAVKAIAIGIWGCFSSLFRRCFFKP